MNNTVEAKNLCFTYKNSKFAIKDVSLTIKQGECIAITGANGSGKTTVGKLIGGIYKPQSGEILIDGKPTAKLTLAEIGTSIGYLFQEPERQLFAPIVLEEITFTRILNGVSKAEAEKQAYMLLKDFSLEHLAARSVIRLSRGEKQRLAICAMLVNNPRFLVLDEPTTGLDSACKEILSSLLTRLMSQGVGIALISHDSEFVKNHAHSHLKLDKGRAVLEAI